MFSLFFLSLLAAATPQSITSYAAADGLQTRPQPGPNQGYGNWHIACDNIASCEANALASDFKLDQPATILVQRQAGQVGYFRVVVRLRDPDVKRVGLIVDGRKLASGDVDGDGRFIVPPARTMTIARALARGNGAVIVDAGPQGAPNVLANISLSGSAAALRRMDAEQARAGTSDAIVARGRRSYRVAADVLPVVQQIAPAKFDNVPSEKALRRLSVESGCAEERPGGLDAMKESAQPLAQTDEEQIALVMIPCGFGAYNFSALPYIARRARNDDNAKWRFVIADFDYRPAWSENPGKPLLVNAFYNQDEGILGSYAKGRGLGDCGNGQSYVWDGERFRLFEASAMEECRGVWEWPTVWRAYVQRQSAPRS